MGFLRLEDGETAVLLADHMDTFRAVRALTAHGDYRTKRLILEIDDERAEAIATGRPYQTRLDRPPAAPRVAHPQRRETAVSGETR